MLKSGNARCLELMQRGKFMQKSDKNHCSNLSGDKKTAWCYTDDGNGIAYNSSSAYYYD